jgi:hypothetical protein
MATLLPLVTTESVMRLPSLPRFTACALLACACSAAMAQYVWTDANGVRQYSDMPPPPGTPAARILKTPGTSQAAPAAAKTDSVPASPSITEREAEYQKRRAEAQQKEKEAEQQAKLEASRKAVCELARSQKRSLESGERLWRLDANGERRYLDDAQRAQELRDVQRTLEGCSRSN